MSKSTRLVVLAVAASVGVSVPLSLFAADRFVDVPASHVFHDDVAWLAETGVTRGCNPPDNTEFCPDEVVTRGQMAAFLRRLAGSRAVDAGTVDGRPASQLEATVTGHVAPESIRGLYITETLLGELDIRAADGRYAHVTLQGTADEASQGAVWVLWAQAGDGECDLDKPEVAGSRAASPANANGLVFNLPARSSFVMEVAEDTTLFLCGWANVAGNVTVEEITISVVQTHKGSLSG